MKEFVEKLREKADVFEKRGCSVDGIVKDYRKSADMIEGLYEKSNISGFVEKLIERLGSQLEEVIGWNHHEANAYGNAIRIVKRLAEEYEECIQDSTKNNQGWILCSERMPKPGKRYLVTAVWKEKDFEKQSVYIFVYGSNGVWHSYNYEPVSRCEIIAWQPLPEPYEREE